MKFGIRQSVGWAEDRRFITGSRCYADDVNAGAGLRGTTVGASMTAFLGSVNAKAAAKLITAALPCAAKFVDISEDQTHFDEGVLIAQNANRSIDLEHLLVRLAVAGYTRPLYIAYSYETEGLTDPYRCQIAEVEIDPTTCAVALARFTVVDDFGVVINTQILFGQIHYGIANGLGQVGVINAPQAVIGGVYDALRIRHVDMTVTPEKIFDILQNKQVDREAG